MSEKELTVAELLGIAGELVKSIGGCLEDTETPGKITLEEWMNIISTAASKAWAEYND